MTIDNLEAIVNPSSEDLLLIRHGGKEWKYPLSTLASNLVNDPTISAATLGTASHPFKTANITTLNVGGSGTVNGNLTVQATADTTEASLLKVEKTLTVNGYITVSGNVKAGTLSVTNDLSVDTLTGPDYGNGTYGNIEKVIVSKTLDVNTLKASGSTLAVTNSGDITTSSIMASALSSLTVSDSITAKALSMTKGTLTVRSGGTVTVGSSSSESGLMTVDSTGNIVAPSLMLMADTTVDLTNVEKNPLAITSGTSVTSGEEATVDPEGLYAAGYLPNIECIISRAPNDTHLESYGYLLTVTGGLRVGRSKDTYNKTPDEKVILPGSYNVWGASIDKDGVISSGCAYKCYGAYTKTDSEGNKTTEDGFLAASGAVIPEELQSNEDTFFTLLGGAIKTVGSIVSKSPIMGSKVFNAVWNDLADCIPVNKEAIIEPGYCYCFDGEKYYKSTKYLEKGIIGIESDTYGMHMGSKPGVKQMDVAVSGFALAYVDKEYEPGTPLTCTENGYLTEIAKQDKIEYPERIVGTYWKPEPNEEWGSSDRKVKVNGRHWIKIK